MRAVGGPCVITWCDLREGKGEGSVALGGAWLFDARVHKRGLGCTQSHRLFFSLAAMRRH